MSLHNFLLLHLRKHVKNSRFVLHHGCQTPRNTLALVFDILLETRMKCYQVDKCCVNQN